jgi:hypothetical protein
MAFQAYNDLEIYPLSHDRAIEISLKLWNIEGSYTLYTMKKLCLLQNWWIFELIMQNAKCKVKVQQMAFMGVKNSKPFPIYILRFAINCSKSTRICAITNSPLFYQFVTQPQFLIPPFHSTIQYRLARLFSQSDNCFRYLTRSSGTFVVTLLNSVILAYNASASTCDSSKPVFKSMIKICHLHHLFISIDAIMNQVLYNTQG